MDEKKLLNGIVVPFLSTFDMSRFYGGVEELEDIDVFGMHTVNRNTAKGGRIYLSSFISLLALGNPSDLLPAKECSTRLGSLLLPIKINTHKKRMYYYKFDRKLRSWKDTRPLVIELKARVDLIWERHSRHC